MENHDSVYKMMKERIPPKVKARILERDGNKCIKCRTSKWLELHHIVPVYRGGTNDESNLITMCSLCHHFAPENPLKLIKYMADPNRPPFDLAIDVAEKAFVSALLLDKEDYEIARSDPVTFWKTRYEKELRNALLSLYGQE